MSTYWSSCVEKLKDIESLEFRVPEANVKLDLTMNALSNFPTYLQMDSSLVKKGARAWRLIRH